MSSLGPSAEMMRVAALAAAATAALLSLWFKFGNNYSAARKTTQVSIQTQTEETQETGEASTRPLFTTAENSRKRLQQIANSRSNTYSSPKSVGPSNRFIQPLKISDSYDSSSPQSISPWIVSRSLSPGTPSSSNTAAQSSSSYASAVPTVSSPPPPPPGTPRAASCSSPVVPPPPPSTPQQSKLSAFYGSSEMQQAALKRLGDSQAHFADEFETLSRDSHTHHGRAPPPSPIRSIPGSPRVWPVEADTSMKTLVEEDETEDVSNKRMYFAPLFPRNRFNSTDSLGCSVPSLSSGISSPAEGAASSPVTPSPTPVHPSPVITCSRRIYLDEKDGDALQDSVQLALGRSRRDARVKQKQEAKARSSFDREIRGKVMVSLAESRRAQMHSSKSSSGTQSPLFSSFSYQGL